MSKKSVKKSVNKSAVIRKLTAKGKSVAFIAKKLGCSENYVYTVQWKSKNANKANQAKKLKAIKAIEAAAGFRPSPEVENAVNAVEDAPVKSKGDSKDDYALNIGVYNIDDLVDAVDCYRDAKRVLASIVDKLQANINPF